MFEWAEEAVKKAWPCQYNKFHGPCLEVLKNNPDKWCQRCWSIRTILERLG